MEHTLHKRECCPGFDGDDCKSTPLDEILADYLKKMDNQNEKEK